MPPRLRAALAALAAAAAAAADAKPARAPPRAADGALTAPAAAQAVDAAVLPSASIDAIVDEASVDRGGTPVATPLRSATPPPLVPPAPRGGNGTARGGGSVSSLLADLVCRGTAGDGASHASPSSPDSGYYYVLRLPVTLLTAAAALVVAVLALFGGVYVYKLTTQHVCACPLCAGKYVIEEKIGAGGFGSVYAVRTPHAHHGGVVATWRRRGRTAWTRLLRAVCCCRRCVPDDDPLTAAAAGGGGGGGGDEHQQHKNAAAALADVLFRPSGGAGGGGANALAPPASSAPPTRFVLKMIPCTDINDASEAQREARDLRYLRHPRIVRYYSDWLHSLPAGAGQDASLYVCIVMERCRTDLRRFIQRHRKQPAPGHGHGHHHARRHASRRAGGGGGGGGSGAPEKPPPPPVPETFIIKVAAQLVSALRYCHSKGVVHRDVKSQK
jgi:hypothetical protein